MKLTEEQTTQLKKWLADGEKLSAVQTLLSEKFGINLTYMELRFLIDDIGAVIIDKPEPQEEPAIAKKKDEMNQVENLAEEKQTAQDTNDSEPEKDIGGNVSVTISPIQRPGAVASGDVIFSDGKKVEWILDQSGRLGLNGAPEGYKPPEADIPVFQSKLQQMIMGGNV